MCTMYLQNVISSQSKHYVFCSLKEDKIYYLGDRCIFHQFLSLVAFHWFKFYITFLFDHHPSKHIWKRRFAINRSFRFKALYQVSKKFNIQDRLATKRTFRLPNFPFDECFNALPEKWNESLMETIKLYVISMLVSVVVFFTKTLTW